MRLALVVMWSFALLVTPVRIAGGAEVPDLMKAMDHAHRAGDAEGCVAVLVAIQREKIWGGFPRGFGPFDGDSFLLKYVRISASVIIGQDGRLVPAVTRKRGDEAEQRLVDALAIEPSDVPGMLSLLRHESPALRWLGLHKADAGHLGDDPTVLDAVTRIAVSDPQVIVGHLDRPAPPAGPPRPTDSFGPEAFVAQVRDEARRLLVAWKKPVPAQEPLDQAGIAMLVLHHRSHRIEVLEVIFQLAPDSPIRATILALDPVASGIDQRIITEFKEALVQRPQRR